MMTTANHTTADNNNNNNDDTDDDDDDNIGNQGATPTNVHGPMNHDDKDNHDNDEDLSNRLSVRDPTSPAPSKTKSSFRDNRQTGMAKIDHDKGSPHHCSESVVNISIDHDSMDKDMTISDDEKHDGNYNYEKDDHADPNNPDSNGDTTAVAGHINKDKKNKKNTNDNEKEEEDGGDNESWWQVILAGIGAGLAGLFGLFTFVKKCCCNNSDDTLDQSEPPK